VGRGTCVPAKVIARLGPGTLTAKLRAPELRSGVFRPTLTPACSVAWGSLKVIGNGTIW